MSAEYVKQLEEKVAYYEELLDKLDDCIPCLGDLIAELDGDQQ